MILFTCRRFSTSSVAKNVGARQRFNMLSKMLQDRNKTSKKKQTPNDYTSFLPKCTPPTSGVSHYLTQESRRQTVLNTLLMKNISDLMSTGEFSKDLSGYGVELHKVQLTADFSVVHVFWSCSESTDTTEIQNILDRNAGRLRRTLMSLHIMGRVPEIRFVKDKRHSSVNKVFQLLAKADLGPNVTRESIANKCLEESLTIPVVKQPIRNDELDIHYVTADEETPKSASLSTLTSNVYGLDHMELMNKVIEKMNKAKAKHRLEQNSGETSSPVENTATVTAELHTSATRAKFVQFLKDHKKLKARRTKGKSTTINLEYGITDLDDENASVGEDEDYYIEDEQSDNHKN